MAKEAINKIGKVSFLKGMNKDLDKSLLPNDNYLDARNFRLVTDEDATTGALENIRGTESFTDYIPAGYRVVGYTTIRNKVIVFVTDSVLAFEGYQVDPDSAIYMIDFGDQYAPGGVLADKEPTVTLLYEDSNLKGRLNFDSSNRIIAIGRYENEDVQKIYWVDGYNKLRWCNIADPDLNNQYIDQFEVLPDVKLFTPKEIRLSSGSLLAGVVSYSYQYFSDNGSETLFSPASNPIHISAANEEAATSQLYKGSEKDEATGMGFSMTVENNNVSFTKVRGVAIHWDTINDVPTIRIFAEQEIDPADSQFVLIDNGSSLGELLYEDYAIVSTTLFSASSLATKDDLLFAGDIIEETFNVGDYDARAYRFKKDGSQQQSRIYDSWTNQPTSWINDKYLQSNTGTTINDITWYEYLGNSATGNTYTTTNIPDDFDCINLYNNYDEDRTDNSNIEHNFEAKFMYDGLTLGGEGINIAYTFNNIPYTVTTGPSDWKALVLNNSGSSDHWFGSGFAGYFTAYPYPGFRSYANPMVAQDWRGYMRGEVYRFGIVFFDKKGRRSTVKWIGDVRMPTPHRDHRNTFKEWAATLAYPLDIEFNVKSMPTGAISYQIVRVPRERISDRNILAQGMLLPCLKFNDIHYHANYTDFAGGGSEYHFNLHPVNLKGTPLGNFTSGHGQSSVAYFVSPEISFNQNLTYSAGDKLDHIADISDYALNSMLDGIVPQRHTIRFIEWDPASNYAGRQDYINDAEITAVIQGEFNVGNSTYNPYRNFVSGSVAPSNYVSNNASFKGTALAIEVNDVNWVPWHPTLIYKPLINYVRNNWLTQYGGNSYEGRASSKYISAGKVRDSLNVYSDTWGGDTFIDMYEHNNLIWDLTADDPHESMSEVIQFPVETSVNLSLRHDDNPNKVGTKTNVHLMQEIKGLHEDSQTPTADGYNQETDLYQYNSVYTQDNHSEYFYPDVVSSISLEDIFDVRIKHSDKKINGELTDSWLKFGVNNYIDVDSTYGKLNSLLNFKNELLFWQKEAFGALSINPRSLISDNNPGQLQLGTGATIERYDYLSTVIGNTNRWGIVQTESGLYWLDNRLKEVYAFVGKTMPITAIKGMKSHFNSISKISDAVVINDRKFDEVLFTIQPTIETVINNVTLFLGLYSYVVIIDSDDIGNLSMDNPWVWIDDVLLPIMSIVEQGGGAYYEVYWLSGHDLWNGKGVNDIIHISAFDDRDTLVLNERVGAFTAFYDFHPHLYIDAKRQNFFSINNHNEKEIHEHNVGDYGKFYGTIYDSTLKVMWNQEYPIVKVYDNISFPTTSIWGSAYDGTDRARTSQVFEDCFYSMRNYNDYQNTGWDNFTYKGVSWWNLGGTQPIERRERIWSTFIPRSKIDQSMDTIYDVLDESNLMSTGNNTERIRDSYMITDLKYTNVYSYNFSVPQLICEYRISKR